MTLAAAQDLAWNGKFLDPLLPDTVPTDAEAQEEIEIQIFKCDWRRYLVCGTLLQCIRRSTLSPARDISSRTLTQRSLLLIQLSSLSSKTELYFRKLIQLSQFGDLTTLIATAFCTKAVDRKCFTGPGCICTLRPHHPLVDVSRRR